MLIRNLKKKYQSQAANQNPILKHSILKKSRSEKRRKKALKKSSACQKLTTKQSKSTLKTVNDRVHANGNQGHLEILPETKRPYNLGQITMK